MKPSANPVFRPARLMALAAALIGCAAPPNVAVAAQAAAATSQPAPAKPSISQKIAADQTKLDLNTATAAQLKTLPGIGDAYAARIIAGRPYTMKTQLAKRGILPATVYSAISDKVIAHRVKK